MPDELSAGLHEALVTEEVLARLDALRAMGWFIDWKAIGDDELPAILARHVHDVVLERLGQVPASSPDRREAQLDIANGVIRALLEDQGRGESVPADARMLLELQRPADSGHTKGNLVRPGISLRDSVLLVNAHREVAVGHQVALEIRSADRIDLLCAFVRFAGLRLIRSELQEFLLRGGQMRVIASVYTGSTERRALDELAGLGAQIKVSYETAQTRLHAKAWLFHRDSGYHTAYVGSSNLTQSALLDGLEWNVRLSQMGNEAIVNRMAATFEQYWSEPEFESYDPRVDAERLERALAAQRGVGLPHDAYQASVSFEPKAFQVEILEALAAERLRGHLRNLVVAPTGTGKTWVSAFDYKRLRAQGLDRMLFVAHRDEILRQSQSVFQLVLDEVTFGERHIGVERPVVGEHVFASIQSLHREVDRIDPSAYDVVIVDEFHHSEAPTYKKLLERLRPRVLIGLTATPERSDGQSVLHWFDDRVAYDMRLWQALDLGLLSPFHYFGIGDGTDLRSLAFERGRYMTSELEGLYTGDHVRAKRILESVAEWVLDPSAMRALGFCAGVAHARFMAEQFNSAGLPATALDGSSPRAERLEAVRKLRRGEIRAIFTVDIFNEGVDIPEVDTILLLRPTESATVFLQQLGRGLRWAEGKSVLTVLDFIGQAHVAYRFDLRYRAILGGTRQQLRRVIEAGFPLMPPGCAIRLDEIAQEVVLENVRASLRSSRRLLIEDLRGLPPETTLSEFVRASGRELEDVYAKPGDTFTDLRRKAGHERRPPSQGEIASEKSFARLTHVDDEERYVAWTAFLNGAPIDTDLDTRSGRLNLMLFAALGFRGRPVADMATALDEFRQDSLLSDELRQLLDATRDQSRSEPRVLETDGAVPLHSHSRYGLYELIAAYGLTSKGLLRETREGVTYSEGDRTDVFFVTLNKSEDDYSPSTRYQDFPISQTLFQWESQSKTKQSSPIAQRYIHHEARGSHVVICVRENRQDGRGVSSPYTCLGPARMVRFESEKPVRFIWELERPMPQELFQSAKIAAG